MLPDPPAHTHHSIESSLPQITQPAKFYLKEDPTQGSWRGDSLTCTQEDFGQTLGKTSRRGGLRPQDYVTRGKAGCSPPEGDKCVHTHAVSIRRLNAHAHWDSCSASKESLLQSVLPRTQRYSDKHPYSALPVRTKNRRLPKRPSLIRG